MQPAVQTARTAIIIEDNPLLGTGLYDALRTSELFKAISLYRSVRQALDADSLCADFVLLDLSLPDGSGLDLVPKFRSANPDVKILVLTVHREKEHTLEAAQVGVDGFILKDEPKLLQKVEDVLENRHPFDARIAGHLIDKLSGGPAEPSLSLTMREQQVLDGLSRGLSYAQVAEKIKVSENTINGYIKSLYRKLGVNSKNQAVYEGTRLGLVRI